MKIYIGPYPTDWLTSNIHRNYMKKKYGYDWDENQTKFETFLEKLEDFIQDFYNLTINKIISNRKRKIKVRIDKYDTWNMDGTLAHIIVPMLKQLKETKHGAPSVDDEDVPEELRSTSATPLTEEQKNSGYSDENYFKRWDYVLDEMIFAFEAKLVDWEDQFYSGVHDHRTVKVEINGKTYYEWQKGPNDTFKVDREGLNKYHARMKNGFRLFGKYYEGLWD